MLIIGQKVVFTLILGSFVPIFLRQKVGTFVVIQTFLAGLLGADNNSNIRRSVQRSYWCKSLHYSAAVSKRLISSDTWFKSIGKCTTVHCCNLLIFCFCISCHKRNTQKKVYRFPVDKKLKTLKRDFSVLFFHQDNVDSTILSAASIGCSQSQFHRLVYPALNI